MSQLIIRGGSRLEGETDIQGAKNSESGMDRKRNEAEKK